jgi:hypothetical protein
MLVDQISGERMAAGVDALLPMFGAYQGPRVTDCPVVTIVTTVFPSDRPPETHHGAMM